MTCYQHGDNEWLAPYAAPGGLGRRARPDRPGPDLPGGLGDDLTILTFGNGVRMSLRVAARLAAEGFGSRVVDLRWLSPLPAADLVREAAATGRVLIVDETRRSGGVGEGVLAALVDGGFVGAARRVAVGRLVHSAGSGGAARAGRGRCHHTGCPRPAGTVNCHTLGAPLAHGACKCVDYPQVSASGTERTRRHSTVSATAGQADGVRSLADRFGIEPSMVVMEMGYDDDVDEDLRDALTERVGELVDEDTDEVVDAVLLWYRDGDGDLFELLIDALEPARRQRRGVAADAQGRPRRPRRAERGQRVRADGRSAADLDGERRQGLERRPAGLAPGRQEEVAALSPAGPRGTGHRHG